MSDTIVYVDDEPAVLRALSNDLRPWLERNNFNLETVESAAACLERLENISDNVVLVISDLRMPGMKGSELIEVIARRYPDVGLVLLTAYTDIEDITRAVSSRLCGLIIKPWDVERLTVELDNIVSKVENKRIRNRRQYELETQLKIAGEFQQRFLETPLPTTDRYSIEVSNRPAPGIYVTGDYYEMIPLDENRVLLLLGDVSGHGIKPAFIATMVKVIVDEARGQLSEPGFRVDMFLDHVNRTLLHRLSGVDEVIVSFTAVLVDLARDRIYYGGGGNPPLCLVRDRTVQPLPVNAPALGFSPDVSYRGFEHGIKPYDRLVLFTDGLYDRGADRSVSWEVLSAIFVQADGLPTFVEHVERILGAVDILNTPAGRNVRSDDLTILTIKLHNLHGRN